ncbi:MAG: peptide chain release factor-like protein [Phycisphaeraceae bacterium]|nr:peptide chain release factor-like protein [Phycisphaeraceae bacterium]
MTNAKQPAGADRSAHPAAWPDQDILAVCRLERGRVGGPGGQHRNKVETAVTLTHTPTGRSAQAAERRSPIENERMALRRLRLELATHERRAVPDGDARSDLWIARTRDGRIAINPTHRDYPTMLAEAMDVLWACRLDVRRAATRLCVSPTQLVRLIAKHPPALVVMNQARAQRKLRPMHP